jgi:predicted metal-dependent HD superfamily phosphohydrolase
MTAPALNPARLVHDALGALLPLPVIDSVLARYDESWRVYHNRAHVLGMFQFAHDHGFKLAPEHALAILFHDSVYDPAAPRGRNERASADLLAELCEALPFEMVATAHQIVLDTLDHVPHSTFSHLVLDLDLSPFILGARGQLDPSRLVWQEYRHLLPDDDGQAAAVFWPARAAVLTALLAKPQLFTSAEFQAQPQLEALARAHLQSELAKAERALVP